MKKCAMIECEKLYHSAIFFGRRAAYVSANKKSTLYSAGIDHRDGPLCDLSRMAYCLRDLFRNFSSNGVFAWPMVKKEGDGCGSYV